MSQDEHQERDETAEPEWRPPNWEPWRHFPIPNLPWEKQVARTIRRKARYRPGVDIQELEMRCVRQGHRLPDTRRVVRMFWLDAGELIGASDGQETSLVYAEWHIAGAVHGRPITVEELRKKE